MADLMLEGDAPTIKEELLEIAINGNEQIKDAFKTGKSLLVKLDSKEAREYLIRISGLLEASTKELVGFARQWVLDFAMELRFMADLVMIKKAVWDERNVRMEYMAKLSIDTRNGLPLFEDVEVDIENARKSINNDNKRIISEFKDMIIHQPERGFSLYDCFNAYNSIIAREITKLGFPPKIQSKTSKILDSHLMYAYGNDMLDFFDIKGINAKKEGLFNKGENKRLIKEIIDNNVMNDAQLINNEIRDKFGEKATDVTTVRLTLKNRFAKGPDCLLIREQHNDKTEYKVIV